MAGKKQGLRLELSHVGRALREEVQHCRPVHGRILQQPRQHWSTDLLLVRETPLPPLPPSPTRSDRSFLLDSNNYPHLSVPPPMLVHAGRPRHLYRHLAEGAQGLPVHLAEAAQAAYQEVCHRQPTADAHGQQQHCALGWRHRLGFRSHFTFFSASAWNHAPTSKYHTILECYLCC